MSTTNHYLTLKKAPQTFLSKAPFSASVKFSFSLSFSIIVSLLCILVFLGPGVIGVVGDVASWGRGKRGVKISDFDSAKKKKEEKVEQKFL